MSAQFEGCPDWYVELKRQEAWAEYRSCVKKLEPPKGVPLTDERIDAIADLVIKGMPDGIRGFCREWGWRQFARALLADCEGHYKEMK